MLTVEQRLINIIGERYRSPPWSEEYFFELRRDFENGYDRIVHFHELIREESEMNSIGATAARLVTWPSTLVPNERIKLTATFLNTVAAGAIVAGAIAPLGGMLFNRSVLIWTMAFAIIWIPIGAALHFLARWLLRRLSDEAQPSR